MSADASTRIWALYIEGSRTVIAMHRDARGYELRRLEASGAVVRARVTGHYDAMLLTSEWVAKEERERQRADRAWQDTALEAGALTTQGIT
jgi:pyruvate carboxylase